MIKFSIQIKFTQFQLVFLIVQFDCKLHNILYIGIFFLRVNIVEQYLFLIPTYRNEQ